MKTEALPVKKMIDSFRKTLKNSYSGNEIMQFIYILFSEYLNWPKTRIHLEPDFLIPAEKVLFFNVALQELINKKPIQYIIGKSWFNGREHIVNPAVLIPRPETEELCNLIDLDNCQDRYREFAVLDIGTGTGCIAIDLKLKFPNVSVVAVDNSLKALATAKQNAKLNSTEITFIDLDILDSEMWKQVSKFDIIVANPPYILESEKGEMATKVTHYEPSSALFVPDADPLKFCRAIGSFASNHLNRSGKLYLEINERFGIETATLIKNFGFEEVKIVKDFFGKERFVKAKVGRLQSQF